MSATNEVSSTMDKTSLSPSQDTEVVKESAPRTPTAEMDVTKGENSVGNGGVSAGGEDNMQYPKGFILAALVGCVMMTVFLIALDQTIVGTAIPKITDEFHGLAQVSWYGSAYFLTLGGLQAPWGKAFKYFSLKPTFLFSIFVFELGSLICGVSPNSVAFIIGRAIAGVGAAGVATGGFTIISFCAPPKQRPAFLGALGIVYAVAAVLGPIIGGAFSDRVSWRWCFYINLPIGGLVVAILVPFFRLDTAAAVVPATWKEKFLQMDPVGAMFTMGGIVCFILALQYGGTTHAWNSSVVIGLLVGFVVIMTALVFWENHQDEYAMLPPRLLKQRPIWSAGVFQFFFAGPYFLLLYYLPIYFQSLLGATPIKSGVDNLPLVIAVGLFVFVGGIAVVVTGWASPFMAIGAALACVASGLFYTMDVNTPSGRWIGFQVLGGAALAFPYLNGLNVAQAYVEESDIASISSIIQFCQILGGAFSISAAQSAFINRLVHTLPANINAPLVLATGAAQLRSVFTESELAEILPAYTNGLRAAFAIAIGMAGVATLLSALLPWEKLPTHGKEGVMVAAV